jgi:hypothetical protein
MTTEEVSLTKPDLAQWMIGQYPESPHGQAFIRHTRDFDNKAFSEDCHRKCGRKATCATVCGDSSWLYFWCDECDPLSTGARRVRIIYTLSQLLQHVDLSAGGTRALKRRLVRQLAEAKGLPKRVGEKQALEFFSQAATHRDRVKGLDDHQGPPHRRKRRRFGM